MRSNSVCLIFNPVAGQGNPDQDLALIKQILEPAIALDICLTTPELGAGEIAKLAVERGVEAVIVSGGDGTISAAAIALIDKKIPLGVISRGTANAFAHALNLPVEISAACENILAGTTRVVDAALCNGMPMILLAGIGFEAETVDLAGRDAKTRLGSFAYVIAGIQQLGKLQQFHTEIETEDKIITFSAAAVTIANAAPPTSILAQGPAGVIFNDGLLDMTIIATNTKASAIAASYDLLTSALRAEPAHHSDIGYLRAKQFKVITEPPQKVVVDGEIIGYTPIEVKCIPNGLIIFAPRSEEEFLVEKLDGLPDLVVIEKD